MVIGFESFREHFKGYEDCYTVIGGTACDILMNEASLDFRATRDIDMILLIESRFPSFAKIFWEYIKNGQYTCGWKNSSEPHFYRFTQPQKNNYPSMIELFSRRPAFQTECSDIHLTPLPVDDEISSLSAIMLDDDYYHLMLNGRRNVDGIPVLDTPYLILFKAKAWLDLSQKKTEKIHVNDRDLKKHKNDVFRLYTIIDPTLHLTLPDRVAADMRTFLNKMESEPVDLRSLKIEDISKEELLQSLHQIYSLC